MMNKFFHFLQWTLFLVIRGGLVIYLLYPLRLASAKERVELGEISIKGEVNSKSKSLLNQKDQVQLNLPLKRRAFLLQMNYELDWLSRTAK